MDPEVIEELIDVVQEEDDSSEVPLAEEEQSIQIAPAVADTADDTGYDPYLFIELGDHVVIDSKKYGGRTQGTVYFRSEERIHVRPDGTSNQLHEFILERTDEDEQFEPDQGVTAVYIDTKRAYDSFVEQQDFRVGQLIDTYDVNGQLYQTIVIDAVNRASDSIEYHTQEEPEERITLAFDFVGIPLDEPFQLMNVRHYVSEEEIDVAAGEEEKREIDTGMEEAPLPVRPAIRVVGVIEVTMPTVYTEAAAHEQLIPDHLQKRDALNDFVRGLDITLQKDPQAIRAIRILVESLFQLKQEAIEYHSDGTVKGLKSISPTDMATLLREADVPLGRPVLNVTKKVYLDDDLQWGTLREEKEGMRTYIDNTDFVTEFNAMQDHSGKDVSSSGSSVPMRWNQLYTLLRDYASPWGEAISDQPPKWNTAVDSEFFRLEPPSTTGNAVPGMLATHDAEVPPFLGEIPFGMERALARTYRKGADRRRQVLLDAEGATLAAYLLFPLRVAPYLGKKRTSNLAMDSGRHLMPLKTMKQILDEIGEAKEDDATSNDLVMIGVDGGTLGNIPLRDYIAGLTLPGLGWGDLFPYLEQYGMTNIELNEEIAEVLEYKIQQYQAHLISALGTLRSTAASANAQAAPPLSNPLFEETPAFFMTLSNQPILKEAIAEYKRTHPTLQNSDIGLIAYLHKRYDNYFQVTAGQSALLIAKAYNEESNLRFLRRIAIESALKYNQEHSAPPPVRNTCPHVADLVAVKRIKDDAERFLFFHEKVRQYEGERKENWIECNVCNKHFICIHERLQLSAFINRKEKATIEKEILLKCSGGQFQGNYICRICGQSLRELDFENRLEFDDEGRPKSGTAVLVDQDAALDKALESLRAPMLEETDPMLAGLNGEEKKCYDVIQEIADRVGIQLNAESNQDIIRRVLNMMRLFPNETQFIEQQRRNRTAGKKPIDYDVAFSRQFVNTCATYFLLDVQTKIPAYSIRYIIPGSRSPGFMGFPLDKDPNQLQGIEYVSFAVATIDSKNPIWRNTGYAAERARDPARLQKGIAAIMYMIINECMKTDLILASRLEKKRMYLTEVLGTAATEQLGQKLRDIVPRTFLPELVIVRPEDAAQEPILPEIAEKMGERGQMALVKLWVRQAHRIAKESTVIVRGSPYSELTCCPAPIQMPSTFWNQQDVLPPLDRRTLRPNQQGNALITHFVPRPIDVTLVEPKKELYHRIFLKYCFTEEYMGQVHEPGVTHQCIKCGFQFPTHPRIMDSDGEGKAALLTALEEEKIQLDTVSFTRLLDAVHTQNEVEPYPLRTRTPAQDVLNSFAAIQPPPMVEWSMVLREGIDGLQRLPPDATGEDIANAMRDFIQHAAEAEESLRRRITSSKFHAIMDQIVRLPWSNFFQVIQSYFLVPFQRLLTQFTRESMFIPYELKKDISETHHNDLIKVLNMDLSTLTAKASEMTSESNQGAAIKMEGCVQQLRAFMSFKNRLRASVVPGGAKTLAVIQRALFYGPLCGMVDPNHRVEQGMSAAATAVIEHQVGDTSVMFLLQLMGYIFEKYKVESLPYDEQEIKDRIAVREEKERVSFIEKFNRLSDEDKRLELMLKHYGMGDWAVGGTKVIYAYDAEYYDKEAHKRLLAGNVDQDRQLYEAQEGYEVDLHANDGENE